MICGQNIEGRLILALELCDLCEDGSASGCTDPNRDVREICCDRKPTVSTSQAVVQQLIYWEFADRRRESRCSYRFLFFLLASLLKRINLCCASFPTAECKQKTACLISICPLLCKRFSCFPANSMFLQLLTCSSSPHCNYEPTCWCLSKMFCF